jgi:hypothetical protein
VHALDDDDDGGSDDGGSDDGESDDDGSDDGGGDDDGADGHADGNDIDEDFDNSEVRQLASLAANRDAAAEHDEGPAAGEALGEDATVSVSDYGTLQDADVLALFTESGGDVLHHSRRSLDFVVFQPPPGQGPHLRSMDELRAYVSAHTL